MIRSLKKTFDISIVAHRGYSKKYPENTLLAFEKAIEAKADYVELDVHATKDGVIVVTHDEFTGRVADKNLEIINSTFEEIETLDLGENQHLPTFEAVLQLCQGKIGINVELKAANVAQQVNDLIVKYNMESDVVISSFLHSELLSMQKINPNLTILSLEPTGGNILAYIAGLFNRGKFIKEAQRINAHGINPFSKYVTKKFCEKSHELNLSVNPWTIDTPKDWEKLIKAGVDSIITNDPVGLYHYLENRAK